MLGRALGLHSTACAGLWQLNFSKLASSSVTRDGDVSVTWLVCKLNEVAWESVCTVPTTG